MPVYEEGKKMPRQYICNVIYTLTGEAFQEWVMDQCEARNRRLADDHNTTIQLDPRIAEVFA